MRPHVIDLTLAKSLNQIYQSCRSQDKSAGKFKSRTTRIRFQKHDIVNTPIFEPMVYVPKFNGLQT